MKKVITFESIHYTIKADKLLKDMGFNYQITTTPRELTSDCGMCLETDAEHFEAIYQVLCDNELVMSVYDL